MSTLGLKLLADIVQSKVIANFNEVVLQHLKPIEQKVYSYMEQHILEFGVIPSQNTIIQKTGVTLPAVTEPFKFYKIEVEKRYLTSSVNTTMEQVQSAIMGKDPYKAIDCMADAITYLLQVQNKESLLDFRYAEQVMKKWHKQKILTGFYGVKSGWPYLDIRMGGLGPGDVLSIVGRMGTGKTFLVLYMAQYAWMYQDLVPLIVTPEMKPMKLFERLTAMHTKSALTPIANAEMTPQTFEKKVLQKMKGLSNGKFPFWIVDGAKYSTIEDLFLLCRQLKPDAVYYDGAYLMKHRNKRLSKWDRIAETASGLKDLASQLDIPVVASYQLGRPKVQKKQKDAETQLGLEDIYGSDEIGQLSSIVLGLLEKETIETVNRRMCTLLKGRGGERGQFPIHWDFHIMDFGEIVAGTKEQNMQLQNI